MTGPITYPEGTGQAMKKYTAAGIVLGLATYGAIMTGSAFLGAAVLIMVIVLCAGFFSDMRHAALMAKVAPDVTDEMRGINTSPARIAIQVLAIMGISLVIGAAIGWVLDTVLF